MKAKFQDEFTRMIGLDEEFRDSLDQGYVLRNFLCIDEILKKKELSYDKSLTNQIKIFEKNNDFKNYYKILKEEFLGRKMKVKLRLTSSDLIERIFLIPISYTLGEMALIMISSLNITKYDPFLIEIGNLKFTINNDDNIQVNPFYYSSLILYYQKAFKLTYQNPKPYNFEISLLDMVMEEYDPSFKVLNVKGYGIYEDKANLIDNYPKNILNLTKEERRTIEEIEAYNNAKEIEDRIFTYIKDIRDHYLNDLDDDISSSEVS